MTIPLADSGVTPDDVYAHRIYAGWLSGMPVSLRHFQVRLNSMRLRNAHEPGPGLSARLRGTRDDCECTFFWMNVDRAPNEWIRLSDFANDDMQDFRQGTTIQFSGPIFDFFVEDGQAFTIRANGYDGGVGEGSDTQDCLDYHMGHHDFRDNAGSNCYLRLAYEEEVLGDHSGVNLDPFHDLFARFDATNGYGVGNQILLSDPKCAVFYRFPVGRSPAVGFSGGASPSVTSPFHEQGISCDPERQQAELEVLKEKLPSNTVFSVEQTEGPDYELRLTIRELNVSVPRRTRVPAPSQP